jgi:hypothetical protein
MQDVDSNKTVNLLLQTVNVSTPVTRMSMSVGGLANMPVLVELVEFELSGVELVA